MKSKEKKDDCELQILKVANKYEKLADGGVQIKILYV